MTITFLCNAGLALETDRAVLLVDVPNQDSKPFYPLPEDEWQKILSRQPPYDKVCGMWFSHTHPDHCDMEKVRNYQQRWPDIPVFLPDQTNVRGCCKIGPFHIEYQRFDHAPIPNAPPHVVTWINAGGKTLYLAADAALDPEGHRRFLRGRRADIAVWNAMYLSRAETRILLAEAASRSIIYHLPLRSADTCGIWKKTDSNLTRYGKELFMVRILDHYPMTVVW